MVLKCVNLSVYIIGYMLLAIWLCVGYVVFLVSALIMVTLIGYRCNIDLDCFMFYFVYYFGWCKWFYLSCDLFY